jgi:hypothetical protein
MGHFLGINSRVHPKYKTKYRVNNWSEYDRALVQRGEITLWMFEDAIEDWKPAASGGPGLPLSDPDRRLLVSAGVPYDGTCPARSGALPGAAPVGARSSANRTSRAGGEVDHSSALEGRAAEAGREAVSVTAAKKRFVKVRMISNLTVRGSNPPGIAVRFPFGAFRSERERSAALPLVADRELFLAFIHFMDRWRHSLDRRRAWRHLFGRLYLASCSAKNRWAKRPGSPHVRRRYDC